MTLSPGRIKKNTRGHRVIRFIETYCNVPEGRNIGKPMQLLPFQKKFILDVYDNPAATRLGILSIARKNGKTALIASIVLAHLVGPEARLNGSIVSGARSRDQAALVFKLAEKIINISPKLANLVRRVPSQKILIGLPMNTEYRAMSSEAGSAHGISPILAIIDEMGQVRGEEDAFIEAIETAQGAYDDALMLVISTQAPTDADMLSVLIDDARLNNDKSVVCHVHEAPSDADILDKNAWKAANPALGKFRSAVELARKAEEAARMPSKEASFRNLYLNQRVNRNVPFVGPGLWRENGEAPVDWGREPVYAGLDLSSVADLTAFVPMAKVDGKWNVRPSFWLPEVGLVQKSKADRVPYDRWREEGYLLTTPGRSIEYEYVAEWLRGFIDSHNVAKIAFDRWSWGQFRPWLLRVGFTEDELQQLFVQHGQGFRSMSPALRELESALLQNKIRHGAHKVLDMCAANAIVSTDPAGNRKLDKSKLKTGRIDGIVALAMAFGVAPVESVEPAAPMISALS